MTALALIAIILALLALRQSIAIILIVSASYAHLVWGEGVVRYLVEDMWNGVSRESLLAIPLFVLCGAVMARGSIARRLIRIMVAITAPLPGGLAVAAILSCAVFAAVSGSSPVTLLAIGAIMYPALLEKGYSRRFSLGALASGGTLGIVIPPSIPMIIYGISTETSITDLFLAGLLPGLLLTIIMATYALIVNRHLGSSPWDSKELFAAVRDGIWAGLMPVVLLGGIYSGYFTATESAAVALLYALAVEVFIHKEMNTRSFVAIALETVKIIGSLFPVLVVALSLNILLAANRVPQSIADWIGANVDSRLAFLIAMNLFLLVVGFFMDAISAILIISPLLLPIAESYGIDPVHLGIIMVINLEIGYLTPPMGLNLIVAMTAFRENFGEVCRAAIPFVGLMLIALGLVTWLPFLSLALVR